VHRLFLSLSTKQSRTPLGQCVPNRRRSRISDRWSFFSSASNFCTSWCQNRDSRRPLFHFGSSEGTGWRLDAEGERVIGFFTSCGIEDWTSIGTHRDSSSGSSSFFVPVASGGTIVHFPSLRGTFDSTITKSASFTRTLRSAGAAAFSCSFSSRRALSTCRWRIPSRSANNLVELVGCATSAATRYRV
jgi:hypothetical protein